MFQRTVARACELWIVTRVVWQRQSLSKPLRTTPQSHALRRSRSRALFCSTSTVVGQDTSSAAQKWPQQWWVNVLCGFWDYMARSLENCNWKLSLKIKAIGRKSMALACQSETSENLQPVCKYMELGTKQPGNDLYFKSRIYLFWNCDAANWCLAYVFLLWYHKK